MWPDLDHEFEMPKLVGTAEEQKKLHDLCLEFKDLLGSLPFGGSDLPPMDIKLKKDANVENIGQWYIYPNPLILPSKSGAL